MSDEEGRPARGERPQREGGSSRPPRERPPRDRAARERPPRDRNASRERPPRSREGAGESGKPPAQRPTTSPENNQVMGIILVVVAIVIGVFLLAKGGDDNEIATAPDNTTQTDDTSTGSETPQSTVPDTIPTNNLALVVANASGTAGLAGDTINILSLFGYQNAVAGNVPNTAASQVLYDEGAESDAMGIAAALELNESVVVPMPIPKPAVTNGAETVSLDGVSVLVILGSDFDPSTIGQGG